MKLDLEKMAECAKEPIHLLGKVQAHGVLLGLAPETLEVIFVSENVKKHFGLEPQEILGSAISQWIAESHLDLIRSVLATPVLTFNNPLSIPFVVREKLYQCDGVAHVANGAIMLELESVQSPESPRQFGVDDYFRLTTTTLQSIGPDDSVRQIAEYIVRDVKEYTGFDRVMVYQFDADYNGEVIAEAREDHLEEYLGLHYPASDIPVQARELYCKSWLRIIRSVHDEGHAILQHPDQPVRENGGRLDLTHATLRTVSPVHLQYLKNMGVEASMSISLLTPEGDLWGLISCHHYQSEYFIPYAARAACTHYALVVSSRITERERTIDLAEKALRRKNLPEAIQLLFDSNDIQKGLIENSETFLTLLDADGMAVVENDWIETVGSSLEKEEVIRLMAAFEKTDSSEFIVSTESILEMGVQTEGRVAGALRVKISADWQVIIFRDELIQSISWGGDPNSSIVSGPDQSLSPRASFKAFAETVRDHSRPWTEGDIVIASEFRSSLAAFVIHRNQQLEALNAELSIRNSEVQQFAYSVSHDLKSPLVTVNGYVQAIQEDFESGDLDDVKYSLSRIKVAVARMGGLIEDLLAFSRVGKSDEAPRTLDMPAILNHLSEEFSDRLAGQGIAFKLPNEPLSINGREQDVVRVFQNLIENAAKYMPSDVSSPAIEICCRADGRETVYEIRDNGAGIPSEYHDRIFRLFERLDTSQGGSGVGLATVAKIMEQHRGSVSLESAVGEGATFILRFPRSSQGA